MGGLRSWRRYWPCPEGEICQADLTYDCEVNIQDVFAVLSAWGPCGEAATGGSGVDIVT